jgi:hypothetical protein
MEKINFYLIIGIFALFVLPVKAQQTLPYHTGFETPADTAGWKTYSLGVTGTYGPWSIGGDLHHDYSNFGPVIDWAVSPALIFTGSGKISFKTQLFYMWYIDSGSYIGIWYSKGNQNPDSGSFTEIVNLTSRAAYSYAWIDTTINLNNPVGKGYIGFKYKTSGGWFTVRLDDITVSVTTDISEISSKNDILIYPNPIKQYGTIVVNPKLNVDGMELHIFDMYGKTIRQIKLDKNSITFKRNDIPCGLYLYQLVSDHKLLKSGKLIFE